MSIDFSFDNQIITALIAAATSLITYIFGKASAMRNRDYSVFQLELSQCYAPMSALLSLRRGGETSAYILEKLAQIVHDAYPYIHPNVLAEYKSLASNSTNANLEHFATIVNSYFNWYRKALGLPCDESSIVDRYYPTYERNRKIYNAILLGIDYIWITSGVFTVFNFYLFISDRPYSRMIAFSAAYFAYFGIVKFIAYYKKSR